MSPEIIVLASDLQPRVYDYFRSGFGRASLQTELDAVRATPCVSLTWLPEVLPYGTIARPDGVDDIARCLVHYWQHRERLAELYRPDWSYLRQFSRDQMAQELKGLFAHMTAGRRQADRGPEPAPVRPRAEAGPQPKRPKS